MTHVVDRWAAAQREMRNNTILRGLGWIASILIAGLVLLLLAGVMDPGPDIVARIDQQREQTPTTPPRR